MRSTFFEARSGTSPAAKPPKTFRQDGLRGDNEHALVAQGSAADSSRFADTRRRPFNLKWVVDLSRCCDELQLDNQQTEGQDDHRSSFGTGKIPEQWFEHLKCQICVEVDEPNHQNYTRTVF